ncbi:XRE family transcriptional regulator [Spirulina subsalsa]|uniref:XRE family transcriptional regulator n=1 Tax=Spirulina subsalsa TaxID=54311 RepID=UPI0002E9D4DB|nr:XRE family transcriptional regulator [Spirulina subsalsa]
MAINILDNIDLRQLGERLQQARKRCGMTQLDAAQIIEAGRTTIVAIEKGDRRLKPEELIKLARAYGQSVSDFVRPRPVVESFDVQFRAAFRRTQEDEAEIQPVIAKFQQFCENYLELEQIMTSPLPRNYPSEYQTSGRLVELSAEAIATQERQRLGLGDRPLSSLRDILEQEVGLRIFYLPMPGKYSEIYSYNDLMGGCLAINVYHPPERQHWSLAHGYLHFLAHRHTAVVDREEQYQKLPESVRETLRSKRLAEAFAKYFLMPTSSLLKQFNDRCRANEGKFTPTDLFSLAHYYGVSVQGLTYRLEEMKLLPSGTWDNLFVKRCEAKERGLKVRKMQQELGLQPDQQRREITPIHYQHLAIEALDQGKITEGQFSRFLGVDRLEARRIAESLRDYSSGLLEDVEANLIQG